MARALRTQYPDAWYHVMNRGGRAELVLAGEKDYELFVALLRESFEGWDLKGRKTKCAIGKIVYVRLKSQPVLITGSEDGYRTLGKYSAPTSKRE